MCVCVCVCVCVFVVVVVVGVGVGVVSGGEEDTQNLQKYNSSVVGSSSS